MGAIPAAFPDFLFLNSIENSLFSSFVTVIDLSLAGGGFQG